MVSIKATCEVNASAEKVWEIVSDVDNDPLYWSGLNAIRNVRKEENLVEREVKVGFMGNEGRQTIRLNPKESIDLTMTKGPLRGSRQMRLIPSKDGKRTKLDVEWDFQFSGVPVFARGFVKSQIEGGTKEALEKVASAAEGSSSSPKVALVSSK
ncbi:MAG TPA: SRPBCC family protein [Nitrososphaerales archaeon]|nr:SRPBCC family protein [Nitrososphaerales archaeon]